MPEPNITELDAVDVVAPRLQASAPGLPDLGSHWDDPFNEAGRTARILIVDSDINRKLAKSMLKTANYEFFEAGDAEQALALLSRSPIDLVIVDFMVPRLGGPEFCRRIKAHRSLSLIPILMVTSVQGVEAEVWGIEAGANEYLTRPVPPSILRSRVRALLRNRAATDSLEEAETILFALAQAVESRDQYTGEHCQRLAAYSVALGMALGLSRSELVALYRGGFLHDIGKVSIPDSILHGSSKLTAEEWEIMKQHTIRGEQICRPMKSLARVLPIIRHHHERWNGSGYPDGLSGESIPLLARILQVVDIFDALTTERTYKKAFPPEEALRILDEEVERGWRDPDLVPLFVNLCQNSLLPVPDRPQRNDLEHLDSMLLSLASLQQQVLGS